MMMMMQEPAGSGTEYADGRDRTSVRAGYAPAAVGTGQRASAATTTDDLTDTSRPADLRPAATQRMSQQELEHREVRR